MINPGAGFLRNRHGDTHSRVTFVELFFDLVGHVRCAEGSGDLLTPSPGGAVRPLTPCLNLVTGVPKVRMVKLSDPSPIASTMNLIDDMLPWVVLLLGLSLPLLAVWLLG
jgi:hypothetical protein